MTRTTPPSSRPTPKHCFWTILPLTLAASLLGACASGPESSQGATDPASVPVVTIEPKSGAAMAPAPAVEPAAPATPAPVTSGAVAPPSPLPAAPVAASTEPATPSAAAPEPHKATAPMTLVKGFYINVGLFAVASNASNAYQKLDKAGLPVFSDGIHNAKGALTRVRVGPYATRAQANAAATKIKSLQLDAVVFKH